MRQLLTGNEAVARGAYEAGFSYASAYPGTPSTEILENIAAEYGDVITSEWAPNEKVALETAIGASISGGRSLAAMKMVGVNVAADPLFSFAYAGPNAAMVLISADDPGMHSSQNEQDNRYYAKFAKIAMLEPANSQEAKAMMGDAAQISEKFDVPVLFRMTTRICHSKSLVELGDPATPQKRAYTKNLDKYDLVPAVSRRLHGVVEQKLIDLEAFSNETELNRIEWNDKSIGIVSSGVAYQYAQEVFGDRASYLKIGFSFPLPMDKIRAFAEEVDTLYVIEELEPFIEEQMKAAGIPCIGKEKLPKVGELSPALIAEALLGESNQLLDVDQSTVVGRPPVLCAGCPHRGFFSVLRKHKNIMISGDIGCYGLGGQPPLRAKDTCICMGASISVAHGAQVMFNKYGESKRVVSTIGDSTFFHTGINSLMHIAYNRSNAVTFILDNRITAMTGQQQNPGTGFTLQGTPTEIIDIETVVRSLGITNVRTVNPIRLEEMNEAIEWALSQEEPTVVITRWPCVLKKRSEADIEEFGKDFNQCRVDPEKCVGCKACIVTGCPALRFDKETKKVSIDTMQCVGCQVCAQSCKYDAISLVR